MRAIGILGSPREKNTYYMVSTVLQATGYEYGLIKLSDYKIEPCQDCQSCHTDHSCATDDDMEELSDKLENADVIVLGSPTYFSNVSGIMKNFMDRCLPFYFSRKLEGKRTGLVTVGNFEDYLEFDENGRSKHIKAERKSVLACLGNMESFSQSLGLHVVDAIHVLHSNPQKYKEELERLGKVLVL